MRHARFVAAARQEFLAEIAYYNEVQLGLGARFTAAVEAAAARALAFPLAGSPSVSNTRRVFLNLAPFGRWMLRDKAAQRRLALRWAP